MVAFKMSESPLSENGVYLVAGHDGALRALVDTRVAATMPDVRRMVEAIGAALDGAMADGVAVSVRFERAPAHAPAAVAAGG